jgi:hypothetical protein
MNSQVRAIARYALLEAIRIRIPQLAALAALVIFAASFFVREIAVTESTRLQASFYAAAMRFTAVFIVALHVLTSVTREFNDKGLEMVLALEVSRSHYILGKLAGFVAVAWMTAAIVSTPLAAVAGSDGIVRWAFSLGLELTIVGCISLFCVMTFSQLLPAASFVAAFYVLARSLTDIRLMGAHPLTGAGDASHTVLMWLIEAVALVMPSFDRWTQTAWIVDQAGRWADVALLAGNALLYATVLTSATMIDFHRKNL